MFVFVLFIIIINLIFKNNFVMFYEMVSSLFQKLSAIKNVLSQKYSEPDPSDTVIEVVTHKLINYYCR